MNLYITEKLTVFNSLKCCLVLFGNFKYIKRTNVLFSNLCVPFREFQVGRVGFDGFNYYIFILTLFARSPKPCQRFMKGRFVCVLQPKPRNR